MLLATVMLLAALGLFGWLLLRLGVPVQSIDAALARSRPWFLLGQAGVIGLLWWKWKPLVTWACRRKNPDAEPHPALFALRERMVLALVVVAIAGAFATAP